MRKRKSSLQQEEVIVNHNFPPHLPTEGVTDYSSFVVLTEHIPIYISGSKALANCITGSNPYNFRTHFNLSVFWIIYFLGVFCNVLYLLNQYYLSGQSPIKAIKESTPDERYIITFSYLLIDAIYPLSFGLLVWLYGSGKLNFFVSHFFLATYIFVSIT